MNLIKTRDENRLVVFIYCTKTHAPNAIDYVPITYLNTSAMHLINDCPLNIVR